MTQNTQNTQTTEDRIYQIMLGSETYAKATYIIAAEIDAKDATIDRLQRELAEARAEIDTLTLKLANARLNLKHCSEEVDKRDECAGELAEARAYISTIIDAPGVNNG